MSVHGVMAATDRPPSEPCETNGEVCPSTDNRVVIDKSDSAKGISGHVRSLTYLPARPPVDIEFSDLTYTVPQGKGKEVSRQDTAG